METQHSSEKPTHAEQPAPPVNQSEPDVYLPGTPTVSFIEYIETAIRMIRR